MLNGKLHEFTTIIFCCTQMCHVTYLSIFGRNYFAIQCTGSLGFDVLREEQIVVKTVYCKRACQVKLRGYDIQVVLAIHRLTF